MPKNQDYPKLTPDQTQFVFDYLKCLFEDDVANYWNKISRIDQARVLGMYKAALDLDESIEISFEEYVEMEFKKGQEEIYKKLRVSPGLSQTQRYTKAGDILVYAFENVKVPVTYIAETLATVFPITLTLDTRYQDNELKAEWRVRIYEDYWFESLDENEWFESLGADTLEEILKEPTDD